MTTASLLLTPVNLALDALVWRLLAAFGSEILDLILFGSMARGDATPDSDIDVLVLVRQESWPLEDGILRLGARVSLEYDVLFNLFVIDQERWQFMREKGFPLARNIEREGIRLEMDRGGATHLASAPHLA